MKSAQRFFCWFAWVTNANLVVFQLLRLVN